MWIYRLTALISSKKSYKNILVHLEMYETLRSPGGDKKKNSHTGSVKLR